MFDKLKEFFNKKKCCVGFVPEFTTSLHLTARIEVGGEEYLIIPDPSISYMEFLEILREWSLSLETCVGFTLYVLCGDNPETDTMILRYSTEMLMLSPFDHLKRTLIVAGLTPESEPPKREYFELDCYGPKLYVQVPNSRNHNEVYTTIETAYCIYDPGRLLAFVDTYGKRDAATLKQQ